VLESEEDMALPILLQKMGARFLKEEKGKKKREKTNDYKFMFS